MSTKYQDSEKQPLLPISAAAARPAPPQGHDEPERARIERLEKHLLIAALPFLIAFLLVLYSNSFISASSSLTPTLQLLKAGLQTAAWSSLPAPVVLFVLAPFVAQPKFVTLTQCVVFLLYLVGVAVGALLVAQDLKGVVVELAGDSILNCRVCAKEVSVDAGVTIAIADVHAGVQEIF